MKSEEDFNIIFTELKKIGVKVPKSKKFKSIVSKQEKALPSSKSKIFGVSLCDQEWTVDSDCLLPKFIASSIDFLRNYINVEGLFRKAGSIARQRELRIKLENNYDLHGSEPNDVASLLKQWLRELPEPLIPNYLHDLYIRCQQLDSSEDRINANLLTSLLLPQDHLFTLKYLLTFLADVAAHSDKNKMGFRNVALIMAPNVFVLGADSADKSSPDLAELHTCVLQLMIENASKVGEVPTSIQHSALEGRICSELLDSSGDVLDFSPCKSRKKRRSGTVQDLFNGIKKLVGQSATPAANAAPRSASKRKAENNDGSLSKKLTVEVNGERISASETPKNKGNSKLVNTEGKAHTRRKSFGLLRKKERKRQKSAQESPQSTMSIGVKSPFSWNVNGEANKTSNSLQVPSPISPFNLFGSDKALKCDSIKKSTSDCYLTVPAQKTFVLSVSSSQGELQGRPKASPYNLRTKFEGGQKSQMQSLESIQLEMKSIIGDAEKQHRNRYKLAGIDKSPLSGTDEVFETSPKPELDDGSNIKRDDPLRKSSCRRKAHKSQVRAAKNVLEDIMVDGENFENSGGSCSMLSETLVQLDAKLSRKGMSRSSHKNGITRQEAFIVKSKQKLKDSLDQLESPEVCKPIQKVQENQVMKDVKHPRIHKSQSMNLDRKSGRKVTRKTSRKASLIRGRPNTVKSGLPSDVCQRFSNDSILLPNENVMLVTSRNTKDNKESLHYKNKPKVDEPVSVAYQETNPLEEKDASLYLKFQNFALSTPPGASTQGDLIPEMHPNTSAAFSIFDDSTFNQDDPKLQLVVPSDATQKRKLSLPIPNGDSTIPESKIPRLRRSLDSTRRISLSKACMDPNSKTTTPKTSGRMSGCNSTKIPVRCNDSLKDLSALDFSMNDSCFKTPNRVASPDSVTWVSGSKYLGLNLPFEDEEATNKRESIAMILKSKPGHVQAKVHLWDTKVRDSVYCTRSVPTYSTPTAAFCKEPSKNRKPLSVSKSCSLAYSTPDDPRKRQSKSQRKQMSVPKRKNQKLLLPPPPKFFDSEPNTPSLNASQTVKEVSPVVNESRNSLNSSPTKDPVMSHLKSSPTKDKLTGSENRKKGKRSSFSDNDSCPLKEVTKTSSVMNESKNSLNGSLNNDENCPLENGRNRKRSSFLDNENRPLKKVTNSIMNESKNSLNASPTERTSLENHKKGKRSSFSDNQSHPLKEVTNISSRINESNNSLNGSLTTDEAILMKLPCRRKGKQSSFSGNTPKKLSKKISRSESSPCRPTKKILHCHQQESLQGISLATTNDYFISSRRLLRSSASKSGSCLSIEKLRSDQMIDEWQCEM